MELFNLGVTLQLCCVCQGYSHFAWFSFTFFFSFFFLGMFSRLSHMGESLSCDLWVPLGWCQQSWPQGLCPNGLPPQSKHGLFWCCVKAFCSAGFYNNDSLDGFFLTCLFPFGSAALVQCSQSSELKFVT